MLQRGTHSDAQGMVVGTVQNQVQRVAFLGFALPAVENAEMAYGCVAAATVVHGYCAQPVSTYGPPFGVDFHNVFSRFPVIVNIDGLQGSPLLRVVGDERVGGKIAKVLLLGVDGVRRLLIFRVDQGLELVGRVQPADFGMHGNSLAVRASPAADFDGIEESIAKCVVDGRWVGVDIQRHVLQGKPLFVALSLAGQVGHIRRHFNPK